ncbi:Probable peroxisomal acyl-coenzyme A oxidase 1 [Eumeta japonica]|uniref:Acyl-coenzyme A oxidase n=1 Tax=Eumeta variegata TaxID=151549 RepID=A0A4C1US32_EUMVA|nr:Probable peroxisomal acyl-coenzyme A oxidase 1 [Eumeta japonica]
MTSKHETTVNIDLQKERDRCTFNVVELTHILDGGANSTAERKKLEDFVLSHKELRDEVPEEYLSHKERYESAIRKSALLYKLMQIYDATDNRTELEKSRANYRNMIGHAVFKDNSPFSLHHAMFIPAIIGQGDKDQQKYWLKRAKKMEIMGTYAQTELGHGTFIRGLETTATYEPETEQFVLHSPTLTAYKWWPGGLAHTANYCVVMANLYIKGKNYGIQPFMVQLRDEETHMPLPGIKLGEIGAKLGFNNVNNGFLGFENHRIPRDRMLMKNAKVLKDGTFVASPNSKLAYGTMIFVRVVIVNGMANLLAKAATIAVRYSAVRRQSQPKPNEPEPQILDYLTQQHKLFIIVATSHAMSIAAKWLWDKYSTVVADLETGKMDLLPELHSLACCLKAVSTSDAAAGVERCRLACGGHGYMHSSNLPFTYGLATAACTYEGENTVLMLQTARSLVKAWQQHMRGEPVAETLSYFSKRKAPLERWDKSADKIINAFQIVALNKISGCVTRLEKCIKSGVTYEDAWNQTSIELVAASEAHCRAVLMSIYKNEVDKLNPTLSEPLKRVLHNLVELYVVYWALEKTGDLLRYTSISERDIDDLQHLYEELLLKLRPNAVGLVDAFDFRDEILNSTLGAYDGHVYERLMAEALKSPLNAEPVNRTFHTHLKPFMQGKL